MTFDATFHVRKMEPAVLQTQSLHNSQGNWQQQENWFIVV
jgi:hypothetical protein